MPVPLSLSLTLSHSLALSFLLSRSLSLSLFYPSLWNHVTCMSSVILVTIFSPFFVTFIPIQRIQIRTRIILILSFKRMYFLPISLSLSISLSFSLSLSLSLLFSLPLSRQRCQCVLNSFLLASSFLSSP